jgi:hypothetical protein
VGMVAMISDWTALTQPGDTAYARAPQFTGDVVTMEEVPTEYLTFFCAPPEHLRRQVAINVEAVLSGPGVRVIPQSRGRSLPGSNCTAAVPTDFSGAASAKPMTTGQQSAGQLRGRTVLLPDQRTGREQ